jgi:glycosyltransferase involved in cell wall biosynthesis
VKQILKRVSSYRVRHIIKHPLTSLSTINIQQRKEVEIFSRLPSKTIDADHMDIAFIVPNPIKGSGGHRNMFRAIKNLKNFGHSLTVYYTQTEENPLSIKNKVSDYFYDMHDILFMRFKENLAYHDICFATWWETAYILKKNSHKIKHPFYFVQDFEPSFMPIGDGYLLAEATYTFGFTHICSGQWCFDFLKRKYNAEAYFFQFPVDNNIYNTKNKRTKKNKNILFFAKPEMPRRCFTLGIEGLNVFSKIRPDVEIILFGSNAIVEEQIPFKFTYKGILPTLDDLANLYLNADLGIVFSPTNPSLVPYEMLSCGCPIADINYDNPLAKYGYDESTVFLLDINPYSMGEQLVLILDDKYTLRKKAFSGMEFVKNNFTTEFEMAKTIENILQQKISNK